MKVAQVRLMFFLVLNEKDCGCTTNGAKLHSAAKAETEHLMLGLTSNTNMHRTSGHMGKEGSPVRIGVLEGVQQYGSSPICKLHHRRPSHNRKPKKIVKTPNWLESLRKPAASDPTPSEAFGKPGLSPPGSRPRWSSSTEYPTPGENGGLCWAA